MMYILTLPNSLPNSPTTPLLRHFHGSDSLDDIGSCVGLQFSKPPLKLPVNVGGLASLF